MSFAWTLERIELLKRLWAEGFSSSHIATELGDGLTRNAVVGKIHRLKLPAPEKKQQSTGRPRGENNRPGKMRTRGRAPKRVYYAGSKTRRAKKAPKPGVVPELEAFANKPLPPELIDILVKKVPPATLRKPVTPLHQSAAFDNPDFSLEERRALSTMYTS
jgi:hypothetical protein